MSLAPVNTQHVLGEFKEVEHGHWFQFAASNDRPFGDDYNVRVFVGHGQWRYARVLKTVAYVVVSEGPNMEPILEKWKIRNQVNYDLSN